MTSLDAWNLADARAQVDMLRGYVAQRPGYITHEEREEGITVGVHLMIIDALLAIDARLRALEDR
jgi:hypothetical protein